MLRCVVWKDDAFVARVRRYPDSITAALDRFNIPVAVYDNLVKAVRDNLHLMHRYVSLRKRALGVDELHMYDVYVPIVPEVDWKVSYEKAKAAVVEGLAPLGEDYIGEMVKGLDSGWVDVVESRGKTSGAYSWGVYDAHLTCCSTGTTPSMTCSPRARAGPRDALLLLMEDPAFRVR